MRIIYHNTLSFTRPFQSFYFEQHPILSRILDYTKDSSSYDIETDTGLHAVNK